MSILLIAFNSIYSFRKQAMQDIESFRAEETANIKSHLEDIVNIAYDMIEHSYRQSNEAGVRERYGFDLEDTLADGNVKRNLF